MRQNREEDFRAGLEILRPFFEELDFELRLYAPQHDERGTTYSAEFVWGNHRVSLEHMYSLGPVIYTIGSTSIEHTEYLEALGVRQDAAYPPCVDDSVAGYEALLQDLQSRLAPFFEEPDREFMELAHAIRRQKAAQTDTGDSDAGTA